MIRANLPTFFVLLVLIASLVWVALSWSYGAIISRQAAEIKLLERQKAEATAVPVPGAYRKSHPAILMVQSTQDRVADDSPGPRQTARADYSDIDADRIERALIPLGSALVGRHKLAFHRLMSKDDEADARVQPAAEHARLGPVLSRSFSPSAGRSQTRDSDGDDQSGTTHTGVTLRDMFDLSPAKLARYLLRRNWVDDYAETAPQRAASWVRNIS